MTEWPDFEQLSAAFATRGSYDTATFFKGASQSSPDNAHPLITDKLRSYPAAARNLACRP